MEDKDFLKLSRVERENLLKKSRDSLPENVLDMYDKVVDETFREMCSKASQMGVTCSSCGIDLTTTEGKVKVISSLRSYMGD